MMTESLLLKYPRTPYWPTSPSVYDCDRDTIDASKLFADPAAFVGRPLVITEKIDGGNTCLYRGEVYSRSVSAPSHAKWLGMVRKYHSYKSRVWDYMRKSDLALYGEDIFGVHSITYDSVWGDRTFYAFAALDMRQLMFMSFDELVELCTKFDIGMVPVLWRGLVESVEDLESIIGREMTKPSMLGGEREGLVLRYAGGFTVESFADNMAKLVRKNHVQTDDHWSDHWVQCKLKG